MSEERKKAEKNPLFWTKSPYFSGGVNKKEIIGMIYKSVAFYSRIECENEPKIEQAMQKR